MLATRRCLIGKTIRDFELGKQPNGMGGVIYNPIITLDDGSLLSFLVEEAPDSACGYGVYPCFTKNKKK